jgi:carboxyl-terminal processing protease
LHEVVFNYYLQHLTKLNALKSPSELIKDNSITTELWQAFKAKLAEKGIQTDTYSLMVQNEIKEHLQSMLSRYIWHTLGYIQMMNMNDPMIKRALEEIKK